MKTFLFNFKLYFVDFLSLKFNTLVHSYFCAQLLLTITKSLGFIFSWNINFGFLIFFTLFIFYFNLFFIFRFYFDRILEESVSLSFVGHNTYEDRGCLRTTKHQYKAIFIFQCLIYILLIMLAEPYLFSILHFGIVYSLIFNHLGYSCYISSFIFIISRFCLLTSDQSMFYFKEKLDIMNVTNPKANTCKPTWFTAQVISFWVIRRLFVCKAYEK
jgi:hypothetical protein